jgi:site-specific recombinase XerD
MTEELQSYFDNYKDLMVFRNFNGHTHLSYCTYIKAYLDYLDINLCKKPEDVSWQELRDFVVFIQEERDLADRTINTCISQLRFFTIYVLNQDWHKYQVPFRKFDTFLPFVPSHDEALTFINTLPDLKQKAMTALLYSSGLRISECCNLKYSDVSRKEMRIHITHSKNRSDRFVPLSQNALGILSEYWGTYGKPLNWLFPMQSKEDKPVYTYYLLKCIHAHKERLGWDMPLTCHSFRHAYGTHLYESGIELRIIQELLGHKCLSSTMIYVHLANNRFKDVVSPFDLSNGEG